MERNYRPLHLCSNSLKPLRGPHVPLTGGKALSFQQQRGEVVNTQGDGLSIPCHVTGSQPSQPVCKNGVYWPPDGSGSEEMKEKRGLLSIRKLRLSVGRLLWHHSLTFYHPAHLPPGSGNWAACHGSPGQHGNPHSRGKSQQRPRVPRIARRLGRARETGRRASCLGQK